MRKLNFWECPCENEGCSHGYFVDVSEKIVIPVKILSLTGGIHFLNQVGNDFLSYRETCEQEMVRTNLLPVAISAELDVILIDVQIRAWKEAAIQPERQNESSRTTVH